ncbi:MAG TPA: hypothetical protein VFP87_15485 [Chitinophagaceae bacterium]|nr:hypothetical protein [Chitinophagaceae bacterium]
MYSVIESVASDDNKKRIELLKVQGSDTTGDEKKSRCWFIKK